MIRRLIPLLVVLGFSTAAFGHFVFIVPDKDPAKVTVILSEALNADEDIDIAILKNATLSLRDSAGHDDSLKLTAGQHALTSTLTGTGNRVLHGIFDLGITSFGGPTPNVLVYYPKAIVGDPFDAKTVVAGDTVVELIPVGKLGALRFKFLAHGKPQPDAAVTILLPDGTQKKVTTDKDGLTPAFDQAGRFGAWTRLWEKTPGERNGKKYDEVHNYATLVIDIPAEAGVTAAATTQAATRPTLNAAAPFATMPEAASSFGAVVSDGWLYIYGGHIAVTHTYSTKAVSGKFSRLNLAKPTAWEELPGGPPLQGMNLAAYDGKIYRIGGMEPHNKPGEEADNHSVADCSRFDPATKKWESLPPLPEPRSSHDIAVVGDKLIVVGGWTLAGKAEPKWLDTALEMDLKAKKLEWKLFKQPFKRRALIAAAHDGKLYVLGGFNEDSDVIHEVAIYDPKTLQWSTGPELPGDDQNTFGPAACSHNGNLYVSLADGILYQLDESAKRWQSVATATPRIVHRIVSTDSQIFILGGATMKKNFDLIEAVIIDPKKAP